MRTRLILLLALLLTLPACAVRTGGRGSSGGPDDDDDSAADDDDSVGDDDDSVGDDDDSVAPPVGDGWFDSSTYCLNWASGTWVSPTLSEVTSMAAAGFDFSDFPILMSPRDQTGSFFTAYFVAGDGCSQDMGEPLLWGSGAWSDPVFLVEHGGYVLTPSGHPANAILWNWEMVGIVTPGGTQIVDGTIEGQLQIPPEYCGSAPCYPCNGNVCLDVVVEGLTWDRVATVPLAEVGVEVEE